MSSFASEVVSQDQQWAVKVRTPWGLKLEYRYATEAQARYFAAIFELGPTRLPSPIKMAVGSGRKSRAAKRAAELANVTTEEIEASIEALENRWELGAGSSG